MPCRLLTGTIGAEHGERSPTRLAQRNGHRTKLLSTSAGDPQVGIPKRKGSFFPELLEPRRRIDKVLEGGVCGRGIGKWQRVAQPV